MFSFRKLLVVGIVIFLGMAAEPSEARLTYSMHASDGGGRFVIISGAFEFTDDLSEFRAVVSREQPVFIGFNSPGGNVIKAMELGRLIRALGLVTLQVRDSNAHLPAPLPF